jgi:hypothetical protein
MCATAKAQTTHMKVTMPFEFTAGNVQLPVCEYKVTALGPWGGQPLSVHNVNSNAESVVVSNSCRSQKPSTDAKLVFYRYGHQYFLAEVWNRNSFADSQLQINPRQTELANKSIERQSRADRIGEVILAHNFSFKPGGDSMRPVRIRLLRTI